MGIRARPARSARSHRWLRRHRLDRPGPWRRSAGLTSAHRSRARAGRHRHLRRGRARRTASSAHHRSRWPSQVQHHSGRPLDLKLRGATYRVRAARVGANRFRIGIDAGTETQTADIDLHRFDRHSGQIVVNGMRHRVTTGTHGPVHLIEVDGVTHRVSRDEGGTRSPAPALVVATRWRWVPKSRQATPFCA